MKNDVCLHGIGSIKQTTLCFFVRQAVAIFQPCTGMVEILSY